MVVVGRIGQVIPGLSVFTPLGAVVEDFLLIAPLRPFG